jgi:quercetin dioxygenase-like cupin family protein
MEARAALPSAFSCLNEEEPVIAKIMCVAVILAGDAAAQSVQPTPAEPSGIIRTNLQERDLGIAGQEAVQVRVDFAPGATAPKHMHPGEEIVYVLKGTLEYHVDGQPIARLKAGDVLFIPSGKPHSVVNVGLEPASELATYVVEKDKPLVVPVP